MTVEITDNCTVAPPRRETACMISGCTASAAAAIAEKPLCLDHFITQSYATLERLDAHRGHTRELRDASFAEVRALLEECSIQALSISMRSEKLNNLERGRLLDVLLWAGELSEIYRPAVHFAAPRQNHNASHDKDRQRRCEAGTNA
jgi:hypothetical protein